jgi:hypothetical protein
VAAGAPLVAAAAGVGAVAGEGGATVTLIGYWVFVLLVGAMTVAMAGFLLWGLAGSLVAWFLSQPNRWHAAGWVLFWVVFVGSGVLALMHEARGAP